MAKEKNDSGVVVAPREVMTADLGYEQKSFSLTELKTLPIQPPAKPASSGTDKDSK